MPVSLKVKLERGKKKRKLSGENISIRMRSALRTSFDDCLMTMSLKVKLESENKRKLSCENISMKKLSL